MNCSLFICSALLVVFLFFILKVAIRTRPLNQRELEKSDFEVVRILDERVVVLIDPGNEMNQNDVRSKRNSFNLSLSLNA